MQENEITKKDILDLIIDNPVIIGHNLGFTLLTDLHNNWIKEMLFAEQDKTLLAHRGSYKTTCLSIAFTLIIIIYPNKNIIFTRKTDDDVKEIIRQVVKMLNTNLIKYFVEKLYNKKLVLIEVNAFSITTNLTTAAKGTSQLLGLGIKTSLTGKHADLVFTDDIVNVKDRVSKAERDLIKLQYQELQNIKNRGGRIFNTGTKWHKEDAIEKLMPNKEIFDCYTSNLLSKEDIEKLRGGMSTSLFAANYELKHIADADAIFKRPYYTNTVESIYNGIAHIDTAFGGADGTAFTILKNDGDNLVMFGKRWDKHVDDVLDQILNYIKIYRAGTVYIEDNADKGYLFKEIRKQGQPARKYHESMNKYIKITTYLKKWWDNIEWLEDTDSEYMLEILDFTENAEHDDSPDSAASIIRVVKGQKQWII